MKVEVDLKKCQDHGQCVYAAPGLFALDDGRTPVSAVEGDRRLRGRRGRGQRRGTARGRRGMSAPGHHGARVDGNAACHRWRRATGERPRRQRSGLRPATGVRGGHLCRHPAARSLDAIPASEGHPPVPAPTPPRMLLVLSENWTLTGGRADLPAAVGWAREAEDAGFDAVMVSEHIVLGPDAGAARRHGEPPRLRPARATRTPTRPGRTPCSCSPRSPRSTDRAAAGRRGRPRTAAPSPAARPRTRHPGPAQRGPARGAAHGELEQGRVRGAGRAVRQARAAAGRAP